MHTWRACAKINLCLEVLGRRSDGYHNILSVMQTIDLYDILSFQPADELHLTCSDPLLEQEENLVLQAARLLQRSSGVEKGATIHLDKRIPVAAGLGGGSSDAATTLVALSDLWGLQMTASNLHNLAAALGSDVPFFLMGGTVLSAGRGDDLSPLPPLPEHWVVLMRPSINIPDKTQLMYANLSPREYTSGMIARHLARSIREGQPLQPGLIFNAFEWIAFRHFDLVDRARQLVVDAGADHVRLCGSGPTLYAIYPEEAPARELFERLQEEDLEVYLARTIEAKPEREEAEGGFGQRPSPGVEDGAEDAEL
jgi:4-diphosphocytidyl-2-C-methyl-D-erythritol kinase